MGEERIFRGGIRSYGARRVDGAKLMQQWKMLFFVQGLQSGSPSLAISLRPSK